MAIDLRYRNLYERFISSQYYLPLAVSISLSVLIYYFMTWPIMAYDTDSWYHLSGGRYFWQNGTIPGDAFFSFITPPRSWYNYYWLFQVIVYKIFEWTGYHGLIALRCFLFLLTALFISFFFVRREDARIMQLFGVALFLSYPIAITLREQLVRPHLFSYLFIVVFLFILEFKRDKVWLLPLLGIFWCNIHGIEYPVMMLIVLGYLAETYYRSWRGIDSPTRDTKKFKWILICTIYTVFFTPHIFELVKTPFDTSYANAMYQHLYIAELRPIKWETFFVYSIFPFSNLISAILNGLVVVVFVCTAICLFKNQLRISHGIIFLGSIVLLLKHNRFIYEFTLLAIPVIRHTLVLAVKPSQNKQGFLFKASPVLMLLMVTIIPGLTYGSHFKNRPEYPFTQWNIPTGTATFLNEVKAKGTVMNEPNTGGYMQWALAEEYKIYMDMQMSLFSDLDYAYVNNALSDENALSAFIQRYDPAFLSVSLNRTKFPDSIRNHEEFRLIFFDDAEALYVNANKFQDIADRYQVKYIDPFQYKNIDYQTETKERLSLIFEEAMRIRAIHPGCGIINAMAANILLVNKEYEQALPYTDAFIRHYPDVGRGYALKADALFGLERFPEARQYYETAIERGVKTEVEQVYRGLYATYVRLQEYKKAYKVLSDFINPFNGGANYRDILELGTSAAAAGKLRDAVTFLKIAQMKAPPDDLEYLRKIRENLLLFVPEGEENPSSRELPFENIACPPSPLQNYFRSWFDTSPRAEIQHVAAEKVRSP